MPEFSPEVEYSQDDIISQRHIYTVSELTKEIRLLLGSAFASVWVEGEISNFTQHTSGHMYFSLKDETAVLNCAMFRDDNKTLKFVPKDGLKVLCFGRISVYDKQGKYQLYVQRMEPKGIGALQLAFQQLKERLQKLGLFDEERKKRIPFLPHRIGVVTSPTGAAIRDILNITQRRYQNVEIVINPVKVQGEGAAWQIAEAIREFNRYRKVDVIIVARGGGSLEDLWAFNEEIVAWAIFDSEIPVISAVGHQVDYTIADFVADFRAPTPSTAAELVIPRKEDLVATLEGLYTRMTNSYLHKLNILKERLAQLKDSYALRHPQSIINQLRQQIDELGNSLNLRVKHLLQIKSELLRALIGRLEALSPLSVLSRGYSVTLKLPDRKIIRSSSEISSGDRIETILHKGRCRSIVEDIDMESK